MHDFLWFGGWIAPKNGVAQSARKRPYLASTLFEIFEKFSIFAEK